MVPLEWVTHQEGQPSCSVASCGCHPANDSVKTKPDFRDNKYESVQISEPNSVWVPPGDHPTPVFPTHNAQLGRLPSDVPRDAS